MFNALGRAPDIQYIAMPEIIRNSCQYFTENSVDNLRRAGCTADISHCCLPKRMRHA